MARSSDEKTECQSYKAEDDVAAPEGGWSWLVVIALALNKMAFWGTLPCFGIVFADVLETVPGNEGASIASIFSIFTVCLDLAGLGCLTLYKFLSFRQVSVLGGAVYFAGSLLASFSISVTQLIITYGAIQGIGYGMMISANLAAFNQHFRLRRTVAMAVAQCSNSAGSLLLPIAVQAVQASVGSRYAKLVLTALCGAAAVSQFLIHAPSKSTTAGEGEAAYQQMMIITEETQSCEKSVSSKEVRDLKQYESKRSQWLQGARALPQRLWRLTGMEAQVVRDPVLLLVATGVSLVHVAEPTFFAMLPLHLRAIGVDESGVARLVSAANAGDFVGRLSLVLAGPWLNRSNRLVFASSALASAVTLFVLSFMTSWATVLAMSVLMGICKGVVYVTFFLTLAEIVATDKFPCACALQFCLQIVFSVSVSPLLGVVRDVTGSFPVCFRVVAGLLALVPLAWGLQAQVLARSRRRRQVRPTVDASPEALALAEVGSTTNAAKETDR